MLETGCVVTVLQTGCVVTVLQTVCVVTVLQTGCVVTLLQRLAEHVIHAKCMQIRVLVPFIRIESSAAHTLVAWAGMKMVVLKKFDCSFNL